jgi:hypothetical protein
MGVLRCNEHPQAMGFCLPLLKPYTREHIDVDRTIFQYLLVGRYMAVIEADAWGSRRGICH